MIGVLLLLQSSMLVRPMYMDPEPPEARALRAIRIVHTEVPGVPREIRRTREEALELARELCGRLARGEDFGALAKRHSAHTSAGNGGHWGSTWPGVLPAPMDEFLYAAEVGDISAPLDVPLGVHIVQRVERDAAVRMIQVNGQGAEARERCAGLLERLAAGEDFAELARTESDDVVSAPRGGVVGIYERGPNDALLRKHAFEMEVGELRGPVESPIGLHILERLPVSAVDPELREDTCARVRAILVSFRGAEGPAARGQVRTERESGELALALYEEIEAGREMAELAAVHDEDPGGAERGGDLGWVRRGTSDMPRFMDRVFLKPKGQLIGPVRTTVGWVLLRRER